MINAVSPCLSALVSIRPQPMPIQAAAKEPEPERRGWGFLGRSRKPKDDIRGSAAYKKDVVRVFVQRGLKAALARAQEVRA